MRVIKVTFQNMSKSTTIIYNITRMKIHFTVVQMVNGRSSTLLYYTLKALCKTCLIQLFTPIHSTPFLVLYI